MSETRAGMQVGCFLSAVLIVSVLVAAQSTRHNRNSQYPSENNIHDLCDVLASPDQFNGKLVSIRGTYRTAFEASELYCLCSPVGIWVDFDGGEKAWKRVDKLMGRRYGTVNGVFTGVFRRGTYGHMDAFGYSLSVSSVSDLELIDHLGLPPSTLNVETRSKVCH